MKMWLSRNWWWLLLIGALLCADFYVSFIWALPDGLFYFAAATNLLVPSLQFYAEGFIVLLATILIIRRSDWNRNVRIVVVVLFLLPLSIAFMRDKFRMGFSEIEYRYPCNGRVYIVVSVFPGEPYKDIYDCDIDVFLCRAEKRFDYGTPLCPVPDTLNRDLTLP